MPVLQRVSVSVKNILLASDFSSASDKAAAYAKALALNFRSSVEIAHVFDPSVVTSYMEAVLGLPVKERQHISNEALERLQREFTAAGIEAHTSLPVKEGQHNSNEALARLKREFTAAGIEPHPSLPVKERQHISNEALERLQREFTAAGIEAHTSLMCC